MSSKHTPTEMSTFLLAHPLSLDICALMDRHGGSGAEITPSAAAKQLNLAITTTATALRELENLGILQSKRVGKERRYTPRNPSTFWDVIEKAKSLPAGRSRVKGTVFPLVELQRRLERELLRSKGVKDLREGTIVETPLMTRRLDFQLETEDGRVCAIQIQRVIDSHSVLMRLGEILLLLNGKPTFDSVLDVNLGYKENYLPKPWDVKKTVELLFGNRARVIQDQVDDSAFIDPEYVADLARRICESLGL